MNMPPNNVVVADRAYEDFNMLNSWDKNNIDFVLLLKKSIKYISINQRELPEDNEHNILIDEEIELKKDDTFEKLSKTFKKSSTLR